MTEEVRKDRESKDKVNGYMFTAKMNEKKK